METFRDWSALARLSPDEIRPETIGFRAFALGHFDWSYRRNSESGEQGERTMKVPFWKRNKRNEELNEEIRAHLLLGEREEMGSDQSRKDAQLAARREFGNETLARETTQDMWGWRWLCDLMQDVRYGLRLLGKNP